MRKKAGKIRRDYREEIVGLTGKRRGGWLRRSVWLENGKVVKYALAYINPRICTVDNGRVLGYDNSHDYHHRHFKGEVTPINFKSYEELVDRFEKELMELWSEEDGQ